MVLATLLPSRTAHRLAPLPRWAMIRRERAMADAQHRPPGQKLAPELQDLGGGGAMVERAEVAARDRVALAVRYLQARRQADLLDLAAIEQRAIVTRLVERELDARRAGV